ncbi:MAG: hypothetical protein NVSMB25_26190 [Thermoleophilaceae bacterium]
MSNSDDNEFSAELRQMEDELRANRAQPSPAQLDEIKLRAMRQASRGPGPAAGRLRGASMRSRLLTLLVAGLLVGGTTAAGIAEGGGNGEGHEGGAARGEYCENHPSAPRCQDNNGDDKHGDHGKSARGGHGGD